MVAVDGQVLKSHAKSKICKTNRGMRLETGIRRDRQIQARSWLRYAGTKKITSRDKQCQ
jgi:hypothetical protein